MALTAKQQRFVEEYLIDNNATQAAIRAGYSARNADKIGSQLLGKTRVSEAIAAGREVISRRTEITQDYVLKRLRENVERAMQAEAVTDREGNETGEYQYAGAVANRALELLGKHLGLFPDKLQVSELPPLTLLRYPSRKSAHDDLATTNGTAEHLPNGNGRIS